MTRVSAVVHSVRFCAPTRTPSLFDSFHELPLEVRPVETPREPLERGRFERLVHAGVAIERGANRFDGGRVDEQPIAPIVDDVEGAPLGAGEHRLARRKRLDHHHPEVVDTRMQKSPAFCVQLGQLSVGDAR